MADASEVEIKRMWEDALSRYRQTSNNKLDRAAHLDKGQRHFEPHFSLKRII